MVRRSKSSSSFFIISLVILILSICIVLIFKSNNYSKGSLFTKKPVPHITSNLDFNNDDADQPNETPSEPCPLTDYNEDENKGKDRQEVIKPKVALIIDDLGYASPSLVLRLCKQPVVFDVAVLPYQEFTKQSAEIAHSNGKEIMVHLPMEPNGYPGPGKDPGVGAVMYDLSESAVRDRVRKAIRNIPFHKGVNNHMGSRITQNRDRMTWVLEEIKDSKCFFVDSRTESHSVAFDVATGLNIPAVKRQVFLDVDRNINSITKQWALAMRIAHNKGQVVIIGHICLETVLALEKLIANATNKVTFVPASVLVH